MIELDSELIAALENLEHCDYHILEARLLAFDEVKSDTEEKRKMQLQIAIGKLYFLKESLKEKQQELKEIMKGLEE